MKIGNHLDLGKTELRNAVLQVLATAPSSPILGQMYYDSSTLQSLQYNGSAWANNATDSLKLNGQLPSYYLSRTNATGTQTASTISDLSTIVQAYRLDQFVAPTAAVSFNSQRITNLADPSTAQDAATMNWVTNQMQASAAGIDSKPSVRVIATSNITLSGTQTIDSISVIVGDRVLVAGQTTGSQNGVYIVASGAWTRATDADQTGEITPGAFWFVEEGTIMGKTQWRANNTGTITLGTTAISIVQFGAATNYTASLGVQLVGNDFRANLAVSGGLTLSGNGIQVDTSIVARKFNATIGDGSATSFVLTHNLGTTDIVASVREVSTGDILITNVNSTSTTTATISFVYAPTSGQYRVTIMG